MWDFVRLWDLGFVKIQDLPVKNSTLWDAKSPKNETWRPITNASKISRSGQNFWIPSLIIKEQFYSLTSCTTLPYLCISGLPSPLTPFTRALHNTRQNISFSSFISKYILYKNKLIIMPSISLFKAKVDPNTSATWRGSSPISSVKVWRIPSHPSGWKRRLFKGPWAVYMPMASMQP